MSAARNLVYGHGALVCPIIVSDWIAVPVHKNGQFMDHLVKLTIKPGLKI